MKNRLSLIMAIASSALLVGCNDDDDPITNPDQPTAYIFHTDFAEDSNWSAGFADYPKGKELEWMLESEAQAEFLLEAGGTDYGFRLQSFNQSDDTKMFLKRELEGLKANTWYSVTYSVELASNIAGNGFCSGIGGSPDALTLKFGASTGEPVIEEGSNGTEVYNYLNIDLGQQTQRGYHGMAVGNIGIEGFPNCDTGYENYAVKTVETKDRSFQVRTDDNGAVWVILATDSGFEGFSNIYFTQASISLEEVTQIEQEQITIDLTNNNEYTESIAWDYPVDREAEWELTYEQAAPYMDTNGHWQSGYYMHFYNRSDDTGMLVTLPLKGLEPYESYTVTFATTIATNVGKECPGIGGAPNEVFVKAGVSSVKPHVEIEEVEKDATGTQEYYRLALDVGEQIEGGEDAVVLGRIGTEKFDFCDPDHHQFALTEVTDFEVNELTFSADENGIAWVYVGIDSGFEGPTSIHFDSLELSIKKL